METVLSAFAGHLQLDGQINGRSDAISKLWSSKATDRPVLVLQHFFVTAQSCCNHAPLQQRLSTGKQTAQGNVAGHPFQQQQTTTAASEARRIPYEQLRQ